MSWHSIHNWFDIFVGRTFCIRENIMLDKKLNELPKLNVQSGVWLSDFNFSDVSAIESIVPWLEYHMEGYPQLAILLNKCLQIQMWLTSVTFIALGAARCKEHWERLCLAAPCGLSDYRPHLSCWFYCTQLPCCTVSCLQRVRVTMGEFTRAK